MADYKILNRWLWMVMALITLASAASAAETAYDSIEWQRISLETKLSEKLVKALDAIIPEDSYFVDVTIRVRAVKATKESQVEHRAMSAASQKLAKIPLGKLNVDVVPPSAASVSGPVVPPDVFASIESATVNIFLDNSIPETRKSLINQIVESIADPIVGEGNSDVRIDRIDLRAMRGRVERPWYRKLFDLGPSSLVAFLVTLLVCGTAGAIFLTHHRLELRKVGILESQFNSSGRTGSEGGGGTKAQSVEVASSAVRSLLPTRDGPGVESFRQLVRANPERACLLIRRWLRVPGLGGGAALAMIPFSVPTPEFQGILHKLTQEERRLWTQALHLPVTSADAANADAFVGNQVVEAMLAPELTAFPELVNRLVLLTPEECVEVIKEDPSSGALIVSVLPTAYVAKIYELLPQNLANEVTQATLNVSPESARDQASALTTILDGRPTNVTSLPFIDKTSELLKSIGPEKEKAIFDLLADSSQYSLLESTARQFFPAELVGGLPPIAIRSALLMLESSKRAELICSRSDAQTKDELIRTLGDEGSRARALLTADLARIDAEPARKQRVLRNRDALWKEFIQAIRRTLQSTDELSEIANNLVNAWLHRKSGGKVGQSADVEPRSAA